MKPDYERSIQLTRSTSGIGFYFTFPRWFKRWMLKLLGKCAKAHPTFGRWFCQLPKEHKHSCVCY